MERHEEMKAGATPASSTDRDDDENGFLVDRVTDLPTVPLLLDQMRHQLEEQGFLSVLSINGETSLSNVDRSTMSSSLA